MFVIILPKVPKDLVSGGTESSDTTPNSNASDSTSIPPHRPIATLHPLLTDTESSPGHNLSHESPCLIPVYNGVSLFPSRDQRLAFRILLQKQFSMEQFVQKSQRDGETKPVAPEQSTKRSSKPKLKYSDAYVLRSSSINSRAVPDVTSLAMACWRIRMWEGETWKQDDQSTSDNQWFETVESRQQLHAGLRRVRHPRWASLISR